MKDVVPTFLLNRTPACVHPALALKSSTLTRIINYSHVTAFQCMRERCVAYCPPYMVRAAHHYTFQISHLPPQNMSITRCHVINVWNILLAKGKREPGLFQSGQAQAAWIWPLWNRLVLQLFFFLFSTPNLWGNWTDLNQTWSHIRLWLLFWKIWSELSPAFTPTGWGQKTLFETDFKLWPNIFLQWNMISTIR